MDTSEPTSPLPQLPVNLDDTVALETWCGTWNAWIAAEAGRQNWPWLKPISPATLREIVDGEKQLRADMALGRHQIELTTARSDLNALETHLRATDPQYEKKRALLVPILQPIFRHVGPSNWRSLFEQAYVRLQVPAGDATPAEQEWTEARTALNDLEGRLKAQDPAYEKKKAFLAPILKPLFKQLPPSKWRAAFEEAYADVRLPDDNAAGSSTGATAPAAEVSLTLPTGTQELEAWLANPKLVLLYWQEIIRKVREEFGKTEAAAKRDTLLQVFTATMDFVEQSLGPKNPQMIGEFRGARAQDYKIFIVQECLIGANVNARLLFAVTRREIEARRMAADCAPIVDPPIVAPSDDTKRQLLNAQIDRERQAILAGHRYKSESMTLLLYRPESHTDQIGVSKVNPPVAGGAFFLDFSRPLKTTRRLLGVLNSSIGFAVEMNVPIVHQNESKGSYEIYLCSDDPKFTEVRALWKARYPSTKKAPDIEAIGFKIITDFVAQFPDC